MTVSSYKKYDVKKILEIALPLIVFIFTVRFPAVIISCNSI